MKYELPFCVMIRLPLCEIMNKLNLFDAIPLFFSLCNYIFRTSAYRSICCLTMNLGHEQVSYEIHKGWEWDQLSYWGSWCRVCRVEMGEPWRSYRAGTAQHCLLVNQVHHYVYETYLYMWDDWLQAADYKRPTYEEVMKTFKPYLDGNTSSAKCKSTKWWILWVWLCS